MKVRLDLTPHERQALLTVLMDYVASSTALEVSIDAVTGEEIEIGDLLKRVIEAPLVPEE
jgi:hypothetical protein